jgi:hypothetical protein
MVNHPNFLGCDLGNEMNNIYSGTNDEGKTWMQNILIQLRTLCPKGVHVNGLGAIYVPTFTPETQVLLQDIVPLHVYPYFWNAHKYGSAMEKPSTHLMPAMAALARSYGRAPKKPIWIQEFGIFKQELPVTDMPRWLETAVPAAIEGGVSWFTWWGSHDIHRRFSFAEIEYDLGLMTVDNQIKEHGKTFKRLTETYRQKPVILPNKPLPPAPAQYTYDAGWKWMLDWMS